MKSPVTKINTSLECIWLLLFSVTDIHQTQSSQAVTFDYLETKLCHAFTKQLDLVELHKLKHKGPQTVHFNTHHTTQNTPLFMHVHNLLSLFDSLWYSGILLHI
jgi:hypothetical protein